MFRIADSHAHLNAKDFDKDREEVIKRAFNAGVKAILCPTEVSDDKNKSTTLSLLQNHKHILAAGGVHPHNARLYNQNHERIIRDMAVQKKITAVGEIGLDFHYNYSPPSKQKEVFGKQLALAQELKLPVIIHSRLAASHVLDSLKKQNFTQGGVLHCFTENIDFAKKMVEQGFYVSFSGIITYPKAHALRETSKKIPSNNLLVETDAPYLTPIPHRKKMKRNEPVFVIETAKILADIKKMPFESFAEKMYHNFWSCFNLNYPNNNQ